MKNLSRRLLSRLFSNKPSNGYKTIVYPTQGCSLVIHDTLDFSPLTTGVLLDNLADHWITEETPSIQSEPIDRHAQDLFFESPKFDINPATGLPMPDGAVDVAGNAFVTTNLNDVLDSNFI